MSQFTKMVLTDYKTMGNNKTLVIRNKNKEKVQSDPLKTFCDPQSLCYLPKAEL